MNNRHQERAQRATQTRNQKQFRNHNNNSATKTAYHNLFLKEQNFKKSSHLK